MLKSYIKHFKFSCKDINTDGFTELTFNDKYWPIIPKDLNKIYSSTWMPAYVFIELYRHYSNLLNLTFIDVETHSDHYHMITRMGSYTCDWKHFSPMELYTLAESFPEIQVECGVKPRKSGIGNYIDWITMSIA